MVSQNQLNLLVPTIFILFLFAPSPSSVIADPAQPKTLCQGDVPDKQYCLQILTNPKAKSARDNVQLTDSVMKLGATKAKETLDAIDAMSKQQKSPEAQNACKICKEVYETAQKSFNMIPKELEENAMSANYDVSVIGPEVDRCSKALEDAHIDLKSIDTAGKEVGEYSSLGAEITDKIQNRNV